MALLLGGTLSVVASTGAVAATDADAPAGSDRLGGSDRVATALTLADEVMDLAAETRTVLLARHDAFGDALAASGLAGQLDAPLLVTPGDRLDARVAAFLDARDVDRALLLGGQAALSADVADQVGAVVAETERVAGADRFATAAAVAGELDASEVDGERLVWLASGAAFPDALAAGAPAAATEAPVLLTAPETVPAATRQALDDLDPDRVVVVGGRAAVGDDVVDYLRDAGATVERLAGGDRTATAAAVAAHAQRFGLDGTDVFLSRGDAFADALAAGPAAAVRGAPLLLAVHPDLVGGPTREALAGHCDTRHTVVGVGATAALTDRALRTGAVALGRCGEPAVSYRYEVGVRGDVAADAGAFAAQVGSILSDERGWALDGELGFDHVDDGGDFSVILASPAEVDAAHPVCGPGFSCRVGDTVWINDVNWREATPAFRAAGGDLATYRPYLVSHEVGHWLGFGHRDCGGAGQPAPVMQQQSIRLGECRPNGWPLPSERERARDDHLP